MRETRIVLANAVTGRWFVALVLALVGVRFCASTVLAYLGTRNVDTTALDGAVVTYEVTLQALLLVLIVLVAGSWPRPIRSRLGPLAAVGFSAATVIQWVGTVDADYRVIGGPLAGLGLGLTATLALAAFGATFDRELGIPSSSAAGSWFRLFAGGFVVAYLLRSLQLVDYAYAFGFTMPTGFLWLFAFGPAILLSVLAIAFWLSPAVVRTRDARRTAAFLGPPIVGFLAGGGLTLGIGGFVLSNLFAWGGGYDVFSPTWASLPLVGFAIGGFAAAAWLSRQSLPEFAWLPLFGGVLVAALSGLQTLGGTVASVSGIGVGLALAGRALASQDLLRRT